jgi:glycosyltransferase involved in cell wall biosynthesis
VTKRLHVCYVNLAFEPCETARTLLERHETSRRFCEALAEEPDVDVTMLARFTRDEDLDSGRVRCYFRSDDPDYPLPRFWLRPTKLLGLLKGIEPDVVHFNGFVFPSQFAQMARVLSPRTALVLQHHGETVPGGFRKLRERLGSRRADAVMFTSREMAEPFVRAGYFPQGTPVLEVLEASSEFTRLPRNAALAETHLTGNPAVLWVGRLHPRKDPVTALQGFASAAAVLPEAHLHMVFSDSSLRESLVSIVRNEPALAGRVHFVGEVTHDRLPAFFSSASLFLTSSPAEGSNYALIEALACGLFPVASDIPSHRAITAHGTWSSLFPPGDARRCGKAIVEAWRRVCREPGLESSLRQFFEDRLSWRSIAGSAVVAYRETIEMKRGRAG